MRLIFPCILIFCDLGAAFVYLLNGDWRRVVYWGAAALLTGAVTF